MTLCHSSTKVTLQGGDDGKGGDQAEEGKSPILCLLHCLPVLSLPLSSYLAILPLTSSQRPFTFFISFVVLPPLNPYSFSLFCQASTQILWPLLFSSTYHVLWLYLYIRKHYLVLFFPSVRLHSFFLLALSIKMETHFCILSVHSDSTTNTRLHASVNNVCSNLNKSEALQRRCPCSTPSIPRGSSLTRVSHLRGLYLYQTTVADIVTIATVSKDRWHNDRHSGHGNLRISGG